MTTEVAAILIDLALIVALSRGRQRPPQNTVWSGGGQFQPGGFAPRGPPANALGDPMPRSGRQTRSLRSLAPLRQHLPFTRLQQPVDRRDRQPDHVRPGPLDPVDEARRAPLNGVSPCFPFRLTAFDVPGNLVIAQGQKPYPGRHDLARLAGVGPATPPPYGPRGPCQTAFSACGRPPAHRWLAQDLAVRDHDRIGRQHLVAGFPAGRPGHGRLVPGHPQGICPRVLARDGPSRRRRQRRLRS
jgi:hypothetical protein